MLRYAVFAFFISIFPMLSHAAFYDGNRLQQWAEADDRVAAGASMKGDQWKVAQFAGYVTGIYDYSELFLCRSQNASVGQIVAIVKKYLAQHPEQWAKPADELVAEALKTAFPCTKK